MFTAIYSIVLIITGIVLLVLQSLHARTQHHKLQKVFLSGKIPSVLPDGIYRGSVPGAKSQNVWKGKKFDQENSTGINLIQAVSGLTEKFPFVTLVGKSLSDKQLNVIKIDYNIPGNPLWLRMIVDEIVETSPNHYLGKLQLRILNFFSFALGYFELEKEGLQQKKDA